MPIFHFCASHEPAVRFVVAEKGDGVEAVALSCHVAANFVEGGRMEAPNFSMRGKAPSTSPMRGSARLPLVWVSDWSDRSNLSDLSDWPDLSDWFFDNFDGCFGRVSRS